MLPREVPVPSPAGLLLGQRGRVEAYRDDQALEDSGATEVSRDITRVVAERFSERGAATRW